MGINIHLVLEYGLALNDRKLRKNPKKKNTSETINKFFLNVAMSFQYNWCIMALKCAFSNNISSSMVNG